MDVKAPLSAAEIFGKIVQGESWAERIFFRVGAQYKKPHLAYSPSRGRGGVYFPPHDDSLVIASWIAHECGHVEGLSHNQGSKLADFFEGMIGSERTPRFIRVIVREMYYFLFWCPRMKDELAAHRTEIRLLRKIKFSLKAVRLGDEAAIALVPPKPWYALVERFFHRQLSKAQDRITQAALEIEP